MEDTVLLFHVDLRNPNSLFYRSPIGGLYLTVIHDAK
ncbi:unnamed protein product, partial [Brugia timori]|uniref:Uncharacterized protein n=1 Tax=Brugia timori TaxID=42155 RepID=A0A0R3R9R4_9BILA